MRRYFERAVGGRKPNAWLGGVHVMYDPARPAGSRITSITLADGQPFDEAATYTVVINDFMLTGGGGLGFPGAADLVAVGRHHGPGRVDRVPQGRATAGAASATREFTPLPRTVQRNRASHRPLREGLDYKDNRPWRF